MEQERGVAARDDAVLAGGEQVSPLIAFGREQVGVVLELKLDGDRLAAKDLAAHLRVSDLVEQLRIVRRRPLAEVEPRRAGLVVRNDPDEVAQRQRRDQNQGECGKQPAGHWESSRPRMRSR